MTRIQWLRNVLFSHKHSCRFLDRIESDEGLKDALNDEGKVFGAILRGTRLSASELTRLADQADLKPGFVGATINDVDSVRMIARY